MKKIVTAAIVLACLTALLLPEGAEADRRPTKLNWRSLDRRFPSNWCPLVFTGPLPEFKADGASATIRFVADGRPGQRIDNVYVVEKSVYQTHLVNDNDCNNGLFFDPTRTPVAFLETFDSEANGWRRVQVSWNREGNGNGALFFDPNGLVAVVASGLKKGTTYVVGASWYTDPDNTLGAVLNIRVDPGDKLGCGSDKAADGFEMLVPEE